VLGALSCSKLTLRIAVYDWPSQQNALHWSIMSATIISLPTRPTPTNAPIYLDAELRPNRSLSMMGFRIVMLSMAAMSFVAGIGFVSLGAWPVIGFFGLDVLLVYLAFKVNFKAGERERETVRVSAQEVLISRTCYRGFTGWWRVSPAFARVVIDRPSDDEVGVQLSAGGMSLPLATCLSPHERLDFARTLETALQQARAERYPLQNQGTQ
jgi:uncharacterized membrane protein